MIRRPLMPTFNAKHTQDFIALGYTQLEQAFETHLMEEEAER